jgi:tetratricopeptide (TPR) repeat protein
MRQAERYLTAGKSAESIRLLNPLLEHYPEDGQLWKLCGLARAAAGQHALAAMALEHASTLVPMRASDHLALAHCYAKTKRSVLARELYQHLSEDPSFPVDLLHKLAAGFGQLKEYRAALKVCRTACKQEPDRPEPHFGVAYYLCRLGYPPRVAIPIMRRVVNLSPQCSFYRATLGLLLAEAGQTQEAYDLLREIPASEAHCSCQLRRMMALFQTMGDQQLWDRYRLELDARKKA